MDRDRSNNAEVAGFAGLEINCLADMAAFDVLPAEIRARLAALPVDVAAPEILDDLRKAVRRGVPPAHAVARMHRAIDAFEAQLLDALAAEREAPR